MRKLLEKFKMEKKVVSIYNDLSDTRMCWTGFVNEVDDDYVLIEHISENGFYGGFCLYEIGGIFNIEQGSSYEKRTSKLYKLRRQSHPSLSLDMSNGLLEALLNYVKNERIFISINLIEDDSCPPTGLIEEIDEEFICLKKFKNSGKENGVSYIKKADIYQLFVDSLPEQNLALLYNDLNK